MRANMKKLSILGSTGSVGTQAVELLLNHDLEIDVVGLSCNGNVDLMLQQAKKLRPEAVVIGKEELRGKYDGEFENIGVKVLYGDEGLVQLASESADVVLNALMGSMGLMPSLAAIRSNKRLALANKESIVTAGELLIGECKKTDAVIIPVDSEHSAIFQSLEGNKGSEVEKIILTASGGPFRGKSREQLSNVTYREALKHPNYSMGRKISIDSATLMNKGLEVIEAKWMFDVNADQIDVVVHPESIIHSLVQYKDSSVLAQMGLPDMQLPILYSMTYPDRVQSKLERLDLVKLSTLHFEEPNYSVFPCLGLAYEALKRGGFASTVLNSANEKLVELFLKEQIEFYDIPKWIEKAMNKFVISDNLTIEKVIEVDKDVRKYINMTVGK